MCRHMPDPGKSHALLTLHAQQILPHGLKDQQAAHQLSATVDADACSHSFGRIRAYSMPVLTINAPHSCLDQTLLRMTAGKLALQMLQHNISSPAEGMLVCSLEAFALQQYAPTRCCP